MIDDDILIAGRVDALPEMDMRMEKTQRDCLVAEWGENVSADKPVLVIPRITLYDPVGEFKVRMIHGFTSDVK